MLILAPFSLKVSENRRKETDNFINSIKKKYKIIRERTENPGEYEMFLNKWWNKEDIIILEHDIVPSELDLEELIKCKYDICAYNYYLYQCSTYLKENVLAHRNKEKKWITEKDDFADLVGFGFIKISLRVQKQIDLINIVNDARQRRYINYTKVLKNQSAGITADSTISEEFVRLKEKIHIHKKILRHNHEIN